MRPRVRMKPVYVSSPSERTVEFSTGKTQDTLVGGLVHFVTMNDGRLKIDVGSLDPGALVLTGSHIHHDQSCVLRYRIGHAEWVEVRTDEPISVSFEILRR